ncbi:MAG: hypothetical protein JW943_16080 [Deltaproteobacteria bacterium]|nr:hypothetical protein [Deltaproteobacteria bacterium]
MAKMLRILIAEEAAPDAEPCERNIRQVLPRALFYTAGTRHDFEAADKALRHRTGPVPLALDRTVIIPYKRQNIPEH